MDSNIILMSIKDKLPKDAFAINNLTEKLNALDDAKKSQVMQTLPMLKLKNPIFGLVLGWVCGIYGVDRFYIGDIGLGIVKLFLTIFAFVFCAIGVVAEERGEETISIVFLIFGVVAFIAIFVWVIADLFIVWKKIKSQNLNKILQIL